MGVSCFGFRQVLGFFLTSYLSEGTDGWVLGLGVQPWEIMKLILVIFFLLLRGVNLWCGMKWERNNFFPDKTYI